MSLIVQQRAGFNSTYRGLPAIYAPISVAATYWPFLLTSAMLHLEDWLTARGRLTKPCMKDILKENG